VVLTGTTPAGATPDWVPTDLGAAALDAARAFARTALSDATRRAYAADWAHFSPPGAPPPAPPSCPPRWPPTSPPSPPPTAAPRCAAASPPSAPATARSAWRCAPTARRGARHRRGPPHGHPLRGRPYRHPRPRPAAARL